MAGPWEGWWWWIPFTIIAALGPRQTWGLFSPTWWSSSAWWTYWLHLLLIVCGNAKSNPGPGSDKRAWVLYSNIHGLHANSDELAVALSDYVVLVCAESKVFGRHHLSELHIHGFGCPNRGCGTPSWCPLSGSLCLLMIPLFLAQSCVFESYVWIPVNPVCFIYSRINNIYVYAFYHNPGQYGSLYDCFIDSMAWVQSVDDKVVFVFVGDANAHHSKWLESVSSTDLHVVMQKKHFFLLSVFLLHFFYYYFFKLMFI